MSRPGRHRRRARTARRLCLAAACVLIGLGAWQLGGGLYIHAKAQLAQVLLSRAWSETLAGGERVRPWPWADTWPVARLVVPQQGIDQIILAGANGRSLAFGPGHLSGSRQPGGNGHSVLGGHRDTHFAFLRDLAPGTLIRIQRPDGHWLDYRVRGSEVVDARHVGLRPGADPTTITRATISPATIAATTISRATMTLVTCYPFDALVPGGPLRLLVFATAEPQRLALN